MTSNQFKHILIGDKVEIRRCGPHLSGAVVTVLGFTYKDVIVNNPIVGQEKPLVFPYSTLRIVKEATV